MFNVNIKHILELSVEQSACTVNDSDLDSVTLKAYKIKDCGRNLGSDNCI